MLWWSSHLDCVKVRECELAAAEVGTAVVVNEVAAADIVG